MRADLAQHRVLVPGRSVTVEVPATSANVGPGFDCFGLALDWRERVNLAVIQDGYRIEVSGEGAGELPRDESHLIIRAVLVGLADLGVQAPGLWLDCRNTIPHARGLGSSSAAIVAGLLAAAGLAEVPARPEWLLGHANAIEGHPDNVAAAIYGGFVLAYEGRAGVTVAQGSVHPSIAAALFIPETSVGTDLARGLLPEMVPHVVAPGLSGSRHATVLRTDEIVTRAGIRGHDQWCWSVRLGAGHPDGSGRTSRSTDSRILGTAQ